MIIGAQKCATTTLFEHLRQHPGVNMPLEKEVPFFTDVNCDAAAWEAYARRYFGPSDGRLWGKATPQYMCDLRAPEQIVRLMPEVKLVAILRDPLQRTLSHYRMGLRRATETLSFDAAVQGLVEPDAIERSRQLPPPEHKQAYESESDFYVAWSEYGRVLKRFADRFGPEQLLVLYTEDLERDPAGTLDRLLAFIGLEPGFRPDSLGKVMHKGGGSNWIPHDVRVRLREQRWLNALWQLVPAERQGRLRFLYERLNVRKSASAEPLMSESTREVLRRHFARDLATLNQLNIDSPPWLGDYQTD